MFSRQAVALALIFQTGLASAAPALSTSVTVAPQALSLPRYRDDVAIDARNGDTFIVQSSGNANGTVLLLKDSDENFREELSLLPGASESAHFEIEMTPSGAPVYLVQEENQWLVGQLERSNNPGSAWKVKSSFQALVGSGSARALTALPDGNLALTVSAAPGAPAEVLILKSEDTARATPAAPFSVVERIAESKLEERASTLLASDESPQSKLESGSGLGFAAGALAGLGIAYRRHFANKWGIQIAGIAFGDANSLKGDLGVNLLRTLSKTQRVRFYVLAGVSAFYTGGTGYETAPVPPTCLTGAEPECLTSSTRSEWTNEVLLNFGAGIGIEIELTKNLGLALELPLTVMLNLGGNEPVFNGVYPIPSASLIYYF